MRKKWHIHIHWCFLNIYGDQTVHVSSVRWWAVHFSSGNKWRERQAIFQMTMHSCHITKWRVSRSAHVHKSVDYNQGTAYRVAYQLQRTGNYGGNIGTLQSLCQVSPMNVNRKNSICKFVRTYSTYMSLKMAAAWTTSLTVTRCSVTTTIRTQNSNPWNGNMWIPHCRSSSGYSPQWVMFAVFCNRKEAILLEFLEPGQSINSDHYTATLTKAEGLNFQSQAREDDNLSLVTRECQAHPSLKTVEHIDNLGWAVPSEPPCSSDLAPSDFHLFRSVKHGLDGQYFSNDVIIATVKQWLTSTGADFYTCGMQALVHHWQICIANGGNYDEKQCFVAENLIYQMKNCSIK